MHPFCSDDAAMVFDRQALDPFADQMLARYRILEAMGALTDRIRVGEALANEWVIGNRRYIAARGER